jgi:PAS domain S-box-containing protein
MRMSAIPMASEKLQQKLKLLALTGVELARSSGPQTIAQSTIDVALELCDAQFGAFYYHAAGTEDTGFTVLAVSGSALSDCARVSMPRLTAIFDQTFDSDGIATSIDTEGDPRHPLGSFCQAMSLGPSPVCSYVAIPLRDHADKMVGSLFLGHSETGAFTSASADLVVAIAAQAAIAIENAHQREQLTRKTIDLEAADAIQSDVSKRLSELAAIVESSDDAILSKDLNGTITSWNRAATRILGYSAEEMIGASILKLIPPELQQDEPVILNRIRAGERIEHFETVRVTKSGDPIDVSLTISPVRDRSGRIVGASKVLRDISSRKRAEISLLQAEKMAAVGRMAATIAHEVNNPLEAVVNLLYLAELKATDPEQAEFLRAADDEVARISHIARQTLGYYRENKSAVSASLAELASAAIRIYQPKCDSAGIRIESHFGTSQSLALRKGEMMQVISNLIANSIHATAPGGTLTLSVKDAPGGVALAVADTGTGISDEVMPRIFDAFFTTRVSVGTGIGLFLAKQFVEGHGGTITAQSSTDPASHGTTMTVFMPTQSPDITPRP